MDIDSVGVTCTVASVPSPVHATDIASGKLIYFVT